MSHIREHAVVVITGFHQPLALLRIHPRDGNQLCLMPFQLNKIAITVFQGCQTFTLINKIDAVSSAVPYGGKPATRARLCIEAQRLLSLIVEDEQSATACTL